MYFCSAFISGCNFTYANLSGQCQEKSELFENNRSNTNLSGASFKGADSIKAFSLVTEGNGLIYEVAASAFSIWIGSSKKGLSFRGNRDIGQFRVLGFGVLYGGKANNLHNNSVANTELQSTSAWQRGLQSNSHS